MAWLAAATIGGAVIGGIASGRAADKAVEGSGEAARILKEATDKAGMDATQLIRSAQDRIARAGRQTLNLLGSAQKRVTKPFQEGNVLAQGVISAGLEQQRNAILGQPTDFSAFDPQTIRVPPGIITQNLKLGAGPPQPVAQPAVAQPQNPLIPNNRFTGKIL